MTPTGQLIVCTRNRASELERCLASVAKESASLAGVIVVDSSQDEGTAQVVAAISQDASWSCPVMYLHSAPGLPRQRNAGIRLANADVLHFVDDDVEVLAGYFDAIHDVYRDHSDVLGVGGIQQNVLEPTTSWTRQVLLRGGGPGRVFASGLAQGVYALDGELSVDWLPGCSMSFRKEVFDRELFDEGLSGYANGEDIDFSYRAGLHGRLMATGRAKLLHHHAPSNRLSTADLVSSELSNRARRVATKRGIYRQRDFWFSVLVQLVGAVGRAVLGRRSALAVIVGIGRGATEAYTVLRSGRGGA